MIGWLIIYTGHKHNDYICDYVTDISDYFITRMIFRDSSGAGVVYFKNHTFYTDIFEEPAINK